MLPHLLSYQLPFTYYVNVALVPYIKSAEYVYSGKWSANFSLTYLSFLSFR